MVKRMQSDKMAGAPESGRSRYFITLADVEVYTPDAAFKALRLEVRESATGSVVRYIDVSATHNSLDAWSPPAPAGGALLPNVSKPLVPFEPRGFVNFAAPQAGAATPRDAAVSCPSCKSDAYDGDSVDFDGASCTQRCSCNECNCEWVTDYMAICFAVLD